MRRKLNKLRTISYRYRAMTNHPSHRESKMLSNKYGEEILSAKRQHWESYLENMLVCDIWMANKYLRNLVGDGGSPQIPTLRTKDNLGRDIEVNDNQKKASLFIKPFFPPPPVSSIVPENFEYPVPIPDPPQFTRARLKCQVSHLSPYKAYGPNNVTNVVLQCCLDLIA